MKELYSSDDIADRVKELGDEITRVYEGGDLVVIGILKGCFIFLGDLVRHIHVPLEIDFARLSSYGNSDSPEHEVKAILDISMDIKGKDVLVVDDILDTGQTLDWYVSHLKAKEPSSIRICTMIDKTARRISEIESDFYGFRMEDGFIVGYGLDFAGKYRSLPGIFVLDPEERRQAG